MQTQLSPEFINTAQGKEADAILRKCVHCGFCNATCPTYQVKGDELDGPRGRIYLIKQMLEGAPSGGSTHTHLDRCLTCRSCETTCPSGVEYGELLEIGREMADSTIRRPLRHQLSRWMLRKVLTQPKLFSVMLKAARWVKPVLSKTLQDKIPAQQQVQPWPTIQHPRQMLILEGCVQPQLAPNINATAAKVLDKLGISLIRAEKAGCCGALPQHLSVPEHAMKMMRQNIDSWWPYIEAGAEAIVMTASGCGVQVKDYGRLLKDDVAYAARAASVAALTKDIAEVLLHENLSNITSVPRKIAYHPPCTLQHGQKLPGLVEGILVKLGHQLTKVEDAHLCCGSAGTYSLLQNKIAGELRTNKLVALNAGEPELIATANIGCICHLQSGSGKPVMHWLELLE
ncbi:MAG: glycolate oxidase subunit GlcF [Methylophilales bacterium]|nr:glycolate oxidase subunit GlcF [Methylophilales bacterium]